MTHVIAQKEALDAMDDLAQRNGELRHRADALTTSLRGMCDAYVALLLMKAEDPSRFQEPGSPYATANALLEKLDRQ